MAPEYSLGGRRADYALCHPPREPVILVEVKQIGQSKDADRQLFEYAFHKGVPMAVLTDGQEWNFFLPTEQGDYGERRVYKLDLLERDPQEAEAGLERYLGYEDVRSGRAIEAARRDYRDAARKRTAQRPLPDAWANLIESEDDILVELLSDKVEDLCGVKPDPDAVAAFLRGQTSSSVVPTPVATPKRSKRLMNPATGDSGVQRSVGYTLDGQWHSAVAQGDRRSATGRVNWRPHDHGLIGLTTSYQPSAAFTALVLKPERLHAGDEFGEKFLPLAFPLLQLHYAPQDLRLELFHAKV